MKSAVKPNSSGKVAPNTAPRQASTPGSAKATGGQMVYVALRRAIMALDLMPGTSLDEAQLCRQYKVSRTPVREALIRLSSEGLAELFPNRGARVASLEFVDVVDHYEAMDVFQPVACHFAAVRRTASDVDAMRQWLRGLLEAVAAHNSAEMIRCNYELHSAIAAACHNRCIERGYRQMLTDKLRLMQHGLPGTAYGKGHALADRFKGTAQISKKLLCAIEDGQGKRAAQVARELNEFVRAQVIACFSPSTALEVVLPLPGERIDAGKRLPARPKRAAKS